ncbi:amidohydrolase family protein [Paenibacillus oceani]|uniref:Amidohydrolase family protein n=1 Tax=Paenibacillus oceani TaxID=2772510 RepID=A0A927CFM3_9BACL|nr:amidohydrolase family protein [Paenibacillus oceani]MBD2865091.1 amidohydrolase family protein [Paenibacillus oceani]
MKWIDCSCGIGYRTVNSDIVNHEFFLIREQVEQARHAEELLETLDFCGIAGAVVYHATMIDVDPGYGNAKLMEETAKAPGRLFPTWTMLPAITDEAFAPEPLFQRMKQNGVRLLRAYPERNRYLLNAITMGEQLDAIAAARIPLYLSPSTGWEHIYSVLEQFPELTVIVHNYGLWSHARFLYPLLRTYSNVYIECGDMQTAGELKHICGKFSSERILFGSDFPSNNIGGPLATVIGSGIGQADIANIAFGNIERLLSEVRL